MRTVLVTAMEAAIKQAAKITMEEKEYELFILNIRRSKIIRVGHEQKTVYDVIVDHATEIADWATHHKYSEISDHVEEKKKKAIQNIKTKLGWSEKPKES